MFKFLFNLAIKEPAKVTYITVAYKITIKMLRLFLTILMVCYFLSILGGRDFTLSPAKNLETLTETHDSIVESRKESEIQQAAFDHEYAEAKAYVEQMQAKTKTEETDEEDVPLQRAVAFKQ